MFKEEKIRLVLVCAILILFSGCWSKDKSKTQSKNIKEKEITEQKQNVGQKVFVVEVTYMVLQDDTFQLFYTSHDSEEKFSSQSSIKRKVKGNEDYNLVLFELPVNVLPYKIRIDLGENREQSQISVRSIKLKYSGKEIFIQKEFIPRFFSINEFLEFNTETGVFQGSVVEGRYDPFIVSSALLNQKIEIEL